MSLLFAYAALLTAISDDDKFLPGNPVMDVITVDRTYGPDNCKFDIKKL